MNWIDRPYAKPKFKSKRHMELWFECDEIYYGIYLWPHQKKAVNRKYAQFLETYGLI